MHVRTSQQLIVDLFVSHPFACDFIVVVSLVIVRTSFIMSSIHLFDPQQSIRFVKGDDLADLQSQDGPQLDGEEIKRFYDDLIGQPSTSASIVKVEGMLFSIIREF